MKRFMAFATAALTLGALFGTAKSSLADNSLQLRATTAGIPSVPPAVGVIDPNLTTTFSLDLFYVPQNNGQITPPIRTSTFQSFLLYDRNKYDDVSFNLTLDKTVANGGPSTANKNALAPTNKSISSIAVAGVRTLNSFNTSVDVLGANPDGFLNVQNLFDGSASSPSAVAGLAFPAAGFKLGTYTFTFKTDPNTGIGYAGNYGTTVVGFADNLIGAGQTLSNQEKTVVGSNQSPAPTLSTTGVFRFAVVPAPSSVAVMAMGGLMPLVAFARRRRAAK